jgi:hypothetical protein
VSLDAKTRLFLVSFLMLFFELACIRWFGSTVVFLTFFTNIVLLATFLGMSVGNLAATSRRDWTPAVVPLFLVTAALAYGSLAAYNHYGHVLVDVGGQGSPQQVYFGTIVKPVNVWLYYALLFAALAVNIVVPMSTFLALPGSQKIIASCTVIFVPIFFAGIVFAMSFQNSSQPNIDFGSNIGGAMLGGVTESLSLMIGFNYLLVVAVVFYGLSAALRRSSPAAPLAATR